MLAQQTSTQTLEEMSMYPGIYADASECMSEPEDYVESNKDAEAERRQRALADIDNLAGTYAQYLDEVVFEEEEDEENIRADNEFYRDLMRDKEVGEAPEIEHPADDSFSLDDRKLIGVIRGNRIVPPAVASYLDENDDEDVDVDAIVAEYYRSHPQTDGFIDSDDEELDEEVQAEIEKMNRKIDLGSRIERFAADVQRLSAKMNELLSKL